jgi:hypothetical protein
VYVHPSSGVKLLLLSDRGGPFLTKIKFGVGGWRILEPRRDFELFWTRKK